MTSDRVALTPCRFCRAGRRLPCVDSFGNEIDQYHQQRVVDSLRPPDHDAIADRVDRGVAELDFTVTLVVLDVREHRAGGAQ